MASHLYRRAIARSVGPSRFSLLIVAVLAGCSTATNAANPAPTLLTVPVDSTTTSTTIARTTTSSSSTTSSTSTTTSSTSSSTATTTTEPPTTTTELPSTTATPETTPAPVVTEPAPAAPLPPADGAQTPNGAVTQPAFDAVVADLMRRRQLPGVSLAVAKDGQLVYAQTYGTRDAWTGAPVEFTSRFNIASLSKVIAATTVLRLAEQGRINLDARVVDVLAGRIPLPGDYDRRFDLVTVRQLVSHTSGINPKPPLGPTGTTSCDDLVHHALGKLLVHDPGNYRYANANYCLLGMVLETLGEGSWFDVVQRETLDPLGITDIALGHPGVTEPGDVIHYADPVGTGQNPYFLDALGPAGQLIATPYDLVRVLDGLVPGGAGVDLIAPETWATMTSPQTFAPTYPEYYGLGVFVYDGGLDIGHTGSLPMVRAMVDHRVDGYTWCILINGTFDDYAVRLRSAMSNAIDSTGGAWPSADWTSVVP